jgi:hypothetical protein
MDLWDATHTGITCAVKKHMVHTKWYLLAISLSVCGRREELARSFFEQAQ